MFRMFICGFCVCLLPVHMHNILFLEVNLKYSAKSANFLSEVPRPKNTAQNAKSAASKKIQRNQSAIVKLLP